MVYRLVSLRVVTPSPVRPDVPAGELLWTASITTSYAIFQLACYLRQRPPVFHSRLTAPPHFPPTSSLAIKWRFFSVGNLLTFLAKPDSIACMKPSFNRQSAMDLCFGLMFGNMNSDYIEKEKQNNENLPFIFTV